jgi:hypothetical protein
MFIKNVHHQSFLALAIGLVFAIGTVDSSINNVTQADMPESITWTHNITSHSATHLALGNNTKNGVSFNLSFSNPEAIVGGFNTTWGGQEMGETPRPTNLATFTFDVPWYGTFTSHSYSYITNVQVVGNTRDNAGTDVSVTVGGVSTTPVSGSFTRSNQNPAQQTTLNFAPVAVNRTGQIVISINEPSNSIWLLSSLSITASLITLESLEVVTQPNKLLYQPGETFNPTGMVVKGTYSNESVTQPYIEYSFFPAHGLCPFSERVRIESNEFPGIFTYVKIEMDVPEGFTWFDNISIDEPAEKLLFQDGERFDATGLVIKAECSYNEGAFFIPEYDPTGENGYMLSIEPGVDIL